MSLADWLAELLADWLVEWLAGPLKEHNSNRIILLRNYWESSSRFERTVRGCAADNVGDTDNGREMCGKQPLGSEKELACGGMQQNGSED